MSPHSMMGSEEMWSMCNQALDACGADQAQVSISAIDSALTRFSKSAIHQNVAERNYDVTVKAAIGKRIGVATTNILSEDSLRETALLASSFAAKLPENPDFVSLPRPYEEYPTAKTFYETTAKDTPEDRAAAVRSAAEAALSEAGALVSGSVTTATSETAVVNSLGLRGYSSGTQASLVVVAHDDHGVSYAEAHNRDVSRIDAAACAREAAERCRRSRDPISIEPGEYEVVLLPYAVIDLLGMLSWMGFGALSLQEGRSFLCGRIGEKVMSDCVSIWDDGTDETGFPRTMDGEGVPRQRVDLISRGIARGVVYDSYTAYREGRESTGHGTGGAGTWGPNPSNLFLGVGDTPVDAMISGMKRGLVVTRFHYTNGLKESESIATGMTRDGTFLVEEGEITAPVKNLRFTDSILRAFSGVKALGDTAFVSPGAAAPAAWLSSLRFTSATEF